MIKKILSCFLVTTIYHIKRARERERERGGGREGEGEGEGEREREREDIMLEILYNSTIKR